MSLVHGGGDGQVFERDALLRMGGDVQLTRVEEVVFEIKREQNFAVCAAVVCDLREELGDAVRGAQRQRGNGEVVVRLTDGDVAHLAWQGWQATFGQSAVGDDDHGGFGVVASGSRRQRERG